MYEKILKLLEDYPASRERRLRAYYLTNLLKDKYQNISWDRFEDMATEYASLIRNWQMVTKDNPHLQGKDYQDGEVLKQEKVLSLRYEVGFNKDIKQPRLLKC